MEYLGNYKMVTALLFDFSRVLLDVKDKEYKGFLNDLHKKMSEQPGYKFFDYFELNNDLMSFLDKLKDKYPLYIFTTGSVQDVPDVRKKIDLVFKKIYSSEELGWNKKDPNSYLSIAKDLNQKPSEILFTDDQSENIMAATTANFVTIKFDSNKQFMQDVSQYVVI